MRVVDPKAHARQMERILSTACTLFAKKGYAETSLSSIAAACKLKKPTLYHYFKNKQSLLHELVHTRMKRAHRAFESLKNFQGKEEFYQKLGETFLEAVKDRQNSDLLLLMLKNAEQDSEVRRMFVEHLGPDLGSHATGEPPLPQKLLMPMHQFMGCLFRYITETRMWKLHATCQFEEKKYLKTLATIFSHGTKALSWALFLTLVF